MPTSFDKFIYLIFLIFLASAKMQGQEQLYRFQRYGVQEGLSQGTIRDILQDKKGFWWFATADGLNRFDGYEFHAYHHHGEDSETLISGDVLSLFEDSAGDIWVATDAGCSKYYHLKDKFITPRFNESQKTRQFFHEDEQRHLWMYLFNGNIQAVEIENNKVISYHLRPDFGIGQTVATNCFFYKSTLYQFFPKFILSFNIKSKKWVKIDKNPLFDEITSSQIIGNKIILGNRQGWILVCDESFNLRYKKKISTTPINHIAQFKTKWLLATDEGLAVFDPYHETVLMLKTNDDDAKSISINLITCLATDKNNSFWVGTNSGGLNRFINPENKFNCINRKEYYLIKAIYKKPKEKFLYCSVFNKGLDIFDLENPNAPPRTINFKKNIFKIEALDDSRLLLFDAHGIYTFDTNTLQYKEIITNLNQIGTKATITAVHQYQPKHFIVAIDKRLYTYTNLYAFYPISDHVFDEDITTIWSENGRELLVGTAKGLYQVSNTKDIKLLLKDIYIKHIQKTTDGSYWIATTSGLYQIDNKQNIKLFNNDKYGLANDFIYGVVEGVGNALWISHNKGLSRLNIAKSIFKNFSKNANLQSYEFNTGAFFHAEDSTIFFGGVRGINYFKANHFFDSPIAPTPIITKIRVNEDDIPLDTVVWYKKYLVFPYDKNTFSFEFTGLQYDNAANNQYYYKMEGIDNSWIFVGGRRFARYPNLPPGKYTFKVRVANEDGNESEQIATLTIKITAPIFMRPWFLILIAMCMLGSIIGIVYYWQRRKIRKQQQALEVITRVKNERERISRELHDNIGAQITYLITSMDWAAKQLADGNQPIKERLAMLRNNAQNMMSSLRDTIWTLNKEEIRVQDFADRLRQYVLYQIRDNSNIELSYFQNIKIEHKLGSDIVLNLFRIAQEAMQNILKHSNAHLITLSVVCEKDNSLVIIIADDGKGFDLNQNRNDSFGLENMKYRTQEIGGVFKLMTAIQQGTRIEIVIQL
jgi:signal transduction histidine kinase